ncbi:hypothetical protein A3E39_04215 [Candidatus Uhrbacteria bacterium RIFCSPHIGHO2_12_FULL_60_25]|uniref:Uncharacterized protein n=1 Tax=Candidatus Uhrbacteria bacterium RIFCSPHIGHO2_12_FULL_60_25 TaxID=1802399 RepID=A0A1F7ULJ8_9BACT|nr:MAG: hypothetical protein A3D73_01240 [Candidatus Uhrbacteria bacterium RIFCSPHIGHO2_02_FULL_60_44]OGL79139.1 MAG: hypothetical protein A3E39_04215 [Candidatus Uhrbacteria bacterium RIFCSPHIGHO2_12_FULL_60_25]
MKNRSFDLKSESCKFGTGVHDPRDRVDRTSSDDGGRTVRDAGLFARPNLVLSDSYCSHLIKEMILGSGLLGQFVKHAQSGTGGGSHYAEMV